MSVGRSAMEVGDSYMAIEGGVRFPESAEGKVDREGNLMYGGKVTPKSVWNVNSWGCLVFVIPPVSVVIVCLFHVCIGHVNELMSDVTVRVECYFGDEIRPHTNCWESGLAEVLKGANGNKSGTGVNMPKVSPEVRDCCEKPEKLGGGGEGTYNGWVRSQVRCDEISTAHPNRLRELWRRCFGGVAVEDMPEAIPR